MNQLLKLVNQLLKPEPAIETEPVIGTENEQTEESNEESNVSLDELSDAETKSNEVNQEDSETSNS